MQSHLYGSLKRKATIDCLIGQEQGIDPRDLLVESHRHPCHIQIDCIVAHNNRGPRWVAKAQVVKIYVPSVISRQKEEGVFETAYAKTSSDGCQAC